MYGINYREHQWFYRQEGAVMVMSLFIGIFLVAMIYHIIGVGQCAVENIMAQDATDSLTYSAAAAKARGMNTIVLINLLMAITLAILVALRLVEMLLVVVMAIVGVACVVSGGAVCGAIAPLTNAKVQVTRVAKQAESKIKPVLEGFEKAADVVNQAVPLLAEAEAIYISRTESQPVSKMGFVWPIVDELPTEKGSFDALCEQAGKQLVAVSTYFLPGNLPSKANETVGELLGSMAKQFSGYFCGGKAAPKHTRQQAFAYPIAADSTCDSRRAVSLDRNAACTNPLCERCTLSACTICRSKMTESGFERAKWTVQVDEWLEFRNPDGSVTESNRTPTVYETRWLNDNPCVGQMACGGEEICRTETREEDWQTGRQGTHVTATVYSTLHSCIVEEDVKLEAPPRMDTTGWPTHRVVKKDARPDDFRVWGIGMARNDMKNRSDDVGKLYDVGLQAAVSGRVTAASAAFTAPHPDMWHMDWYARLIRFRMPENGIGATGCSGKNARTCKQVSGKIESVSKYLNSQILH